jgi:hypothetical protein
MKGSIAWRTDGSEGDSHFENARHGIFLSMAVTATLCSINFPPALYFGPDQSRRARAA